mmetsp:Transcript_36236/g.90933  ORF Transcript_36236/g.90933 Transcript_36236/m.90933 type:complete len:229 (-) Transcript_36236:342-1028(-)
MSMPHTDGKDRACEKDHHFFVRACVCTEFDKSTHSCSGMQLRPTRSRNFSGLFKEAHAAAYQENARTLAGSQNIHSSYILLSMRVCTVMPDSTSEVPVDGYPQNSPTCVPRSFQRRRTFPPSTPMSTTDIVASRRAAWMLRTQSRRSSHPRISRLYGDVPCRMTSVLTESSRNEKFCWLMTLSINCTTRCFCMSLDTRSFPRALSLSVFLRFLAVSQRSTFRSARRPG